MIIKSISEVYLTSTFLCTGKTMNLHILQQPKVMKNRCKGSGGVPYPSPAEEGQVISCYVLRYNTKFKLFFRKGSHHKESKGSCICCYCLCYCHWMKTLKDVRKGLVCSQIRSSQMMLSPDP